ncbi:MAG: PorT family protein [Prevotellaceae bacterium]|jgi:hypothetical protein|nr:PorT family protein [Prevotellaceae bacterium]
MKKLLFILVIFLPAHLLFAGEFWVGTTQGLNLSQVSFVPTVKQSYLSGYNGGIVARYISEPNLGLQAELNFSQRGWSEKHDDTGSIHRRMNYVELPVMTHIYFGKRAFRCFVNLGPKIGFFTGENKPAIGNNPTVIEPAEPDTAPVIMPDDRFYRFNEPVNLKFDYAIVGGVGFGLQFRRFFYQVEGRYGFGLGDFFDSEKNSKNEKANPYSRSAFRTVSVNFSILYKL